ncbi:hypothetical protein M0813_13442 [Anaeramoeba flamelloides]|uniref:Cyclin N-terminal domain-containing protein n=1 Tax=Anaeramoeba flamelloides TaxID=1746091 RepID=A0ABQ8Z8E8_9EUKA|nr:hypothetical protein M0813_13442 [Anaeramoeba flamelloides]
MNNFYVKQQSVYEFWVGFMQHTKHKDKNIKSEQLQIFDNSCGDLDFLKTTIMKIICQCPCSYESLIHSVELMRRIVILNKGLEITPTNCLYFLITSIMVSSKFCDDICYDNQSYAQILEISLELMNELEVAFLFSINWNLVLDEGEFEDTLDIIYKKQYHLFYPYTVQKVKTTKRKQEIFKKERISSQELTREDESYLKERKEIINLSPGVIKRNSYNNHGSEKKIVNRKMERGIPVTNHRINNSPRDYQERIQPRSTVTKHIHNTNIILDIPIDYQIENYNTIYESFDHYKNNIRKRDIPQKYFQEQDVHKNGFKRQFVPKKNQYYLPNQYY